MNALNTLIPAPNTELHLTPVGAELLRTLRALNAILENEKNVIEVPYISQVVDEILRVAEVLAKSPAIVARPGQNPPKAPPMPVPPDPVGGIGSQTFQIPADKTPYIMVNETP